jgi:regulator of protease activity HflC (stomatin/prohibitin superfamily)
MSPVAGFFLALIVLLVVFAAKGVRLVQQSEQGLVEQFGRYQKTVGPGLRFIVPFIQALQRVDMREQVVDVPPQEVITRDNVVVTVDAVVYYQATDPVKLKYNVANFIVAATKLAQTNLRNVVGDMDLDDALTSRDVINTELRNILDEATDVWGTRVVRVEIQRIDPPEDVTDAMHRQMKAERDRRALVTEAEGTKSSQILKAEGIRESQVLEANGRAEAIKQLAEAEAFQRVTLAEGEAQGIERVFRAIHEGNPTPDLLAVKYLETLATMSDGQATKIFMPLETAGALGSLAAIGEVFNNSDGADGAAS